jgi:hypothetical protein
MPTRPAYVPRSQAKFNLWANAFSRTVAADPAQFSLTAADAEKIAAKVAGWNKAYKPAVAKGTRTRATVAAKNLARKQALKTLRKYAQQIAHSTGVSADQKVGLGINPGTSVWRRIQPPATHPVLWIIRAANLQFTLRYADNLAAEKIKAKPKGVGSCQIFYSLRPFSSPPITDYKELREQLTVTRSPHVLDFPDSAGGQQCYLAGYWLLRNGKRGGWGPITSFTVPRGG